MLMAKHPQRHVTVKTSSEQENLQSQNGTTEQETLDVKPLVRHLITFTSMEKDVIVISNDEDEPKDVKPLI